MPALRVFDRDWSSSLLIDEEVTPIYDFVSNVFGNLVSGMSVSTLSRLVCCALILGLPASLPAVDSGSAILHTQGSVWVNGSEAPDATAIFPGDLLETKPGFAATLNADGSTALIQPESIVRFQGDLLVLEHGSVSVGTSKAMRVKVNCLTVVPVLTQWTQYDVSDVSGRVLVAARKNDAKIDREGSRAKISKGPETDSGAIVHEGEQATREESEVCGAPQGPATAGHVLNPKWIAAGAAGGGILTWLLLHGGPSHPPISSSKP